MKQILGIHHITAIAGDPQQNLDFYTGALGLRLVKLTVNFDDPGTYHFYFGNGTGAPGTILTFFPWAQAPKGRQGTGQAGAVAFAVPPGALDYWSERLRAGGAVVEATGQRFGQNVLSFNDPDGLPLELVESAAGPAAPWAEGLIPPERAIRGFAGITLVERQRERTAHLLVETMGFKFAGQEANRHRFLVGGHTPDVFVDILEQPDQPAGRVAVGTVHHVAWRTPDTQEQIQWQRELGGLGLDVSPVMDRVYFRSIYYREPGGILFEIATDPPGFIVDETAVELGSRLRLPPWLEGYRRQIEEALAPLRLPQIQERPLH